MFQKIWHKSNFVCFGIERAFRQLYAYTSELNMLEPDQRQHVCFGACAIAQQYSSATFISLPFHSRKEKCTIHFKNVIISILFYFFKIAYLQLLNLHYCVSLEVSVCIYGPDGSVSYLNCTV
jgi:hypothetical protein